MGGGSSMIRYLCAASAFVTGLIILAVYVFLETVPFTEIYLVEERIGDAIAGNVLYFLGVLAFVLAIRKVKGKTGKILLMVLGLLFTLGVTIQAFLFQANSFRGAGWAFETLLIRLLPFVFLLSGVLILLGVRVMSLILGLVFGGVALVHWFLGAKTLFDVLADRAFSSANTTGVVIAATIAMVFSIFALLSFMAFRKHQPQRTFIHRVGGALASKTGIAVIVFLSVVACIIFGITYISKAKSQNVEEFLDAAQYGDVEKIREMLDSGIDVNATNEYGNTALLKLSSMGADDPEIIKVLLQAGADVNAQNESKRTALMVQASYYQVENVKALLDAGADANLQSESGVTALMETVKYPPDEDDEKRSQLRDVVQALLSAGTDMALTDEDNASVAHHATEHGLADIISLLGEKGMDFNQFDAYGQCPLTIAAQYNRVAVVRELIKAGADLNLVSENGLTPLFAAAEFGRDEIFAALIQAGANADYADENGHTIFCAAARKGSESMVRSLLNKGIRPDGKEDAPDTPLIAAAAGGYAKIVQNLLDAGAQGNRQNELGQSALHCSTSRRHLPVIKILLEAGADANLQDQWQQTALFVAISEGSADAARLLLDAGAKTDIKDKYGQTLLDAAQERGNQDLIDLLGSK